MRMNITAILSLLFVCSFAQSKIRLSIDKKTSYFFDTQYISAADSAFKIASAVLSSKEFQDEIQSLNFNCESNCTGCTGNDEMRIKGSEVLEKLFHETDVTLKLTLYKRGSALGETSANSYSTTAWYEQISEDMPEFSFAYALAVNLCHEYMHQVGYCHLYCSGWLCPKEDRLRETGGRPDSKFYKDDVTYRVGWAAYYLLLKKKIKFQ